eukprot:5717093-Alexandrium_andersonii.AAC.1
MRAGAGCAAVAAPGSATRSPGSAAADRRPEHWSWCRPRTPGRTAAACQGGLEIAATPRGASRSSRPSTGRMASTRPSLFRAVAGVRPRRFRLTLT